MSQQDRPEISTPLQALWREKYLLESVMCSMTIEDIRQLIKEIEQQIAWRNTPHDGLGQLGINEVRGSPQAEGDS